MSATRQLKLRLLLCILLAAGVADPSSGDTVKPTREEVFANVQALVEQKDLYAASEYVLAVGDEHWVAQAFEDLVVDCHHKARSIEQVLHFVDAGIHHALARAVAHDGRDEDAARSFRFSAKRLATNGASYTWPGWDEPELNLSPEQTRQGLALARYAVRQLHELDPTPAQVSFTCWFLGAHLIASGNYADAAAVFEQAKEAGLEQGDNPDGVAMLEGYLALTRLLAGGEADFDAALAKLEARDNDDARFYAQQLRTARRVFE